MKVLIYTASSLCNPQFGIQMETAIEYSKRGDDVVFTHCSGVMSACSANFLQNEAICKLCGLGFKAGLRNLPKNVRIVKLLNPGDNNKYVWKFFKTIADIKAYCYRGVEVGFSVLSVYITKTRNPNPIINDIFLDCINKMLKEAEYLIDAADELIKREKPDLVIYFNGRFFDTKPFYNLAQRYHINFLTTENIGGVRANDEYRMVRFYNSIPFDANTTFKNCLDSWNKSTKSESEKIKIGSSFYEKRRNGMRAGDYVYTSNQIKGKLPECFNVDKKNVVIYCSSEDEFSSVSIQVDKMFIFKSQYDAIKYLAENINDNEYHFIVRIHPNMRNLDVDYHRNLYKLSNLKNITVIAPEETVSSYTLMDVAYNIVLFGSTIGAEALYWGKPVVLLGHADYYYWKMCSIPYNPKELIDMVKNPIVYSGAKDMAIKYGYYFLNNSLSETAKYISITPRKLNILGKQVYIFDYLKFMGSSKLYKCILGMYNKVIRKFYKNHIVYPDIIRN